MKETDLMVGDWVMRKNDHPIKIEEILVNDDGYAINGIWDYHELRSWINIDDINPIPLTPEILERNRFEYKDGWEEWWHRSEDGFGSDFQLSITERGFSIKDIDNAKINFVHQLQHALRLCGLDNLADNLKMEG